MILGSKNFWNWCAVIKQNKIRPTLRGICASLPKGTEKTFWIKLWVRRVSFYVAWVAIRLGLRANYVSYISIVVGLAACYSVAFYGYWGAIIGAILFNIWLILDCADGNVARVMHESGGYGDFVDAVSGYIVMGFGFLSTGLHAAPMGKVIGIPIIHQRMDFVLLGAIASICCILARLIYQKFVNVTNTISGGSDLKSNNISFFKKVDLQLGLSGFFMPMIIICSITSTMYIIPLFYGIYYFFGLVGIIFWRFLKV